MLEDMSTLDITKHLPSPWCLFHRETLSISSLIFIKKCHKPGKAASFGQTQMILSVTPQHTPHDVRMAVVLLPECSLVAQTEHIPPYLISKICKCLFLAKLNPYCRESNPQFSWFTHQFPWLSHHFSKFQCFAKSIAR